MSIFSYNDYKVYLRDLLTKEASDKNESSHRVRSLADLARKTGYQRSFFSRVIHAELHLTSEAAFKVSNALKFSDHEYKYFSWLIEKARAGDKDYKKYAEAQAQKLKDENEHKQKSILNTVVSDTNYLNYYMSSWIWSAVHLATSVENLQTPEKISAYLKIPEQTVIEVLHFLQGHGLVRAYGNKFVFDKGTAFFREDSPWAYSHGSNWRQKALAETPLKKPRSQHFTNVMTISSEDFEKIREVILKSIEKINKISVPSEPEEVVCLNVDYFKLS